MTAEKVSPVINLAAICTLKKDDMCACNCADCPKVIGDPFASGRRLEVKATDLSPVKPRRLDKAQKDKKPSTG